MIEIRDIGDTGDGIVISNISFGYEKIAILQNINVNIRKGRVVSLLGPNGCGKTTLLKIINGSLKSEKGTVYIDGSDIRRASYRQIARKMGQVSQNHKSSFPFTVLDVVLTGRAPYVPAFSSPGTRDMSICSGILEKLGITHLSQKPYTRISGGERQLVMIARALVQEPKFLLLDEPTTFLDLKNQMHILKSVVTLARERNITVLMTLHDPNHALMFSDAIILMKKPSDSPGVDTPPEGNNVKGDRSGNNIVSTGSPAEVITTNHMKEAYGIDVDIIDHNGCRLIVPRI